MQETTYYKTSLVACVYGVHICQLRPWDLTSTNTHNACVDVTVRMCILLTHTCVHIVHVKMFVVWDATHVV